MFLCDLLNATCEVLVFIIADARIRGDEQGFITESDQQER